MNDYLDIAGDDWRKTFVPLIQGVMTDQGKRWASELGQQFDVRNFYAEAWFDDYVLEFADPIVDSTKSTMGLMFGQAQAEGWSIGEMQSNLETMFRQWSYGDVSQDEFEWYAERFPAYRTEMIARTETMRASNAGTTELFRDWGVTKHEWLSARDNRVRDSHSEADGQIVGIDEPFIVGGEELLYPGDPNGSPEETIQCRCSTLPVIEKE